MRIRLPFCLLATLLASCFAAVAPAHANTSAATFVSHNGNDANANPNLCAIDTPCKTLGVALSVTSLGGVVACLDSTFSFGPLTINQDVTIDCNESYGAIFTQGVGIQINATGKVVLRGLTIYSPPGFNGTVGIDVKANGYVSIEKCKVFGFQTTNGSGAGIYIEVVSQVEIRDSVIESNAGAGVGVIGSSGDVILKIQGSTITGNAGGVVLKPSGSEVVAAAIDDSRIDKNIGAGLRADGTAGGTVTVSAANSSFSLNGGGGVNAVTNSSGNVALNLNHDLIASNGAVGVQANGGLSVVTVGSSTLANNGAAWSVIGGATLLSFQNNQVTGPTGTVPSPAFFQ